VWQYIYALKSKRMKNILRALVAGWGAKKIGGGKCGCIGTIIIFIILYVLLGPVFNLL
jgi:uncharacterized protein YqgC (DUF456 family)